MTEDEIISQYVTEAIDKVMFALPNVEEEYSDMKKQLQLTMEQEDALTLMQCIEYKALYHKGFRDCARLLLRLLVS